MAIVMQAFILMDTDNPELAHKALFKILNDANFDSGSPVLDFALGFSQTMPLDDQQQYVDGSFVHTIPGAVLLATANRVDMPC